MDIRPLIFTRILKLLQRNLVKNTTENTIAIYIRI